VVAVVLLAVQVDQAVAVVVRQGQTPQRVAELPILVAVVVAVIIHRQAFFLAQRLQVVRVVSSLGGSHDNRR